MSFISMHCVKLEQVPFSPPQNAVVEQQVEPSSSSSLVKSVVGELNSLSSAITSFTKRWNDLEHHLHSIQNSLKKFDEYHLLPDVASLSEIERICVTMKSRLLRRYVARHLNEINKLNKLRDEVSKAVKRSPDPSKLVLGCIASFYLKGRKDYAITSPTVDIRRSCILILESFLYAGGGGDIDPCVKEKAEKSAIAWRTRILHEGGIANASPDDALGLLLFVASFGIPSEFASDQLYQLICLGVLRKKSKSRMKASVLRLSPALFSRVQDIIQGLVDNGMLVEAVCLSCAFKLKDKYPPRSLLSSFIQEVNQATEKMRREGQDSHVAMRKADDKQLAALKSVIRCVEDHQLDRSMLSRWKIDEKIANLENLKAASKRGAEHVSTEKLKTHEAKRHQPTTAQRHTPMVTPSQEKSLLHDGLSDGGYTGKLSGFPGTLAAGPIAALSERGLRPGNFLGASTLIGGGPLTGSGVVGNVVGSFPGIDKNRMGTYSWHGNDSTGGRQSFPSSAAMQGGYMGANGLLLSQTQRAAGSNLYQFAGTVAQSEEVHDSSAFYRQTD